MTDFEPVKKGPAGVLPAGTVTITANGVLSFPQRTFAKIGQPTAIMVYTNGEQAAFRKAPGGRGDRQQDNCYVVTQNENSGYVHFERLISALEIPEGRHTIEYNEDDELWVLEVNDE